MRQLTPEAQQDREEFEVAYMGLSCSCWACGPCGWCTHPGNPHNQEDDEFYEAVQPKIDYSAITRGLI